MFYTNAKQRDELRRRGRGAKVAGLPHARARSVFRRSRTPPSWRARSSSTRDTQASATNLKRRMVGQAPYVFNAGLTYLAVGNSTSATLLFNRVGERIDAAGDRPLPDVIERVAQRARSVASISGDRRVLGAPRRQESARRAVPRVSRAR